MTMKAKPKSKSLAVWSPLPPAPTGIADYVAEQLPLLAKRFDLVAVAEDPAGVDRGLAGAVRVVAPAQARADLHVYHLGNSPAHAFVHRQARSRPGVVVLHEWSLHHLVLHETLERGDPGAYLGEMRRAYGELGSFVGRQVVRGLGGSLFPSLLPLNERLLESSLAAVTLTEALRPAVARRMPGRPVLALPLHFSSPLDPAPSREEARRALGLPGDAFVICAPGLGTAAKRLDLAVEAAARMERARPGVLLVVAGELDSALALPDRARDLGFASGLRVTGRLSLPDFTRHLCAADVVLALRFPSYGEMSAALVRALGLGRPAFVTAGTPAALELPRWGGRSHLARRRRGGRAPGLPPAATRRPGPRRTPRRGVARLRARAPRPAPHRGPPGHVPGGGGGPGGGPPRRSSARPRGGGYPVRLSKGRAALGGARPGRGGTGPRGRFRRGRALRGASGVCSGPPPRREARGPRPRCGHRGRAGPVAP